MQRRVMTRSQVSKARQQGCCEPLLGGDSPPMRKRAPSNEHESRAEGSAPRDRISKTGTPTHAPYDHWQSVTATHWTAHACHLLSKANCLRAHQEPFGGQRFK